MSTDLQILLTLRHSLRSSTYHQVPDLFSVSVFQFKGSCFVTIANTPRSLHTSRSLRWFFNPARSLMEARIDSIRFEWKSKDAQK